MKCVRRSWFLVAIVLISGVAPFSSRAGEGQAPTRAIDPRYFELILRTLEQCRDDLIEDGTAARSGRDLRRFLRDRARRLVANVAGEAITPGGPPELPDGLIEEADRLVDLVLVGFEEPSPIVEGDSGAERGIPPRVVPFERVIEAAIAARTSSMNNDDVARMIAELERFAVDLLARAVCPTNATDDLSAEERAFAVALARRVARDGKGEPNEGAGPDEFGTLAGRLRIERDRLAREEPGLGVEEITHRLEEIGRRWLDADRASRGEAISEGDRARLSTLSALIARGVAIEAGEGSPEPSPEDPPEVPPIDRNRLDAIAGLLERINRGLRASGVEEKTRRSALRAVLLDRLAGGEGMGSSAEVERLIDRILKAGQRTALPRVVVTGVSVSSPIWSGPVGPGTTVVLDVEVRVLGRDGRE
ncbi:hypothetical protein [Tautonia sociabilis]|uniref:Uncharacterized protein n=1 Tax=Tautonia sociabilis TaxID=2080755 RepID=A0A432MQD6_9BACT|nr:hypothetical protein [Tautonia sociabilis]RUL89265.1 hypothetical protein TsocGM_02270 [Tautonia sociabilis]